MNRPVGQLKIFLAPERSITLPVVSGQAAGLFIFLLFI
jgi:hypothetical protein